MHISPATLAALTLLASVTAKPILRRDGQIVSRDEGATSSPIHIHIKDTNDENIEWIDVSGGDGHNPLKIKIAIIETNNLAQDVTFDTDSATEAAVTEGNTNTDDTAAVKAPSPSSAPPDPPAPAPSSSEPEPESGGVEESNAQTETSPPTSGIAIEHQCSNPTFYSTTSPDAPLASDCKHLASIMASKNKVYNLEWSHAGFYRLVTYKSCTFGYKTYTHTGTNRIASADIANVMYETFNLGYEKEGRISAKGEMQCGEGGHKLVWGYTAVGDETPMGERA